MFPGLLNISIYYYILGGRKLGFMHRKVGKTQIDGGPSFRALFLGQHKTPPFLVVATDTRWGDGKTRKLAPQIQLFSWTGWDSSPKKNVPRENNALLGCEIFRGSSHQKGDEASENVSAAQPWRFHSRMGGGSTLNFKGSTPRAHCDPVENTSRHFGLDHPLFCWFVFQCVW